MTGTEMRGIAKHVFRSIQLERAMVLGNAEQGGWDCHEGVRASCRGFRGNDDRENAARGQIHHDILHAP